MQLLFDNGVKKFFILLEAFTSLHTVSHYLPLSEFCGQISENVFFFLDLIVQKRFFYKNHWFQPLSTKNDWVISLFLISITLHSLAINHSIMSSVRKETSFGFWWKLYCYSSPSHFARENFVCRSIFCFFFFFFYVFFFWPLTTTLNLQDLTHSKPPKCTNQVTLRDKHIANQLSLWALGDLVY